MLTRSFLRNYPQRRFFQTTSFKTQDLVIKTTTTPKPKVQKEKLLFGRTTTDHIFEVEWNQEGGWGQPAIKPYHNLDLDPACSVFHYALECFEGMKAFKDSKGQIRLFRPMDNMDRMVSSARRLYFPEFDQKELLNAIQQLVLKDSDWIPDGEEYSLYIRPTMIATQPVVSVGPSSKVLLYVILCPVGPYFPNGFKPVKLYADTEHARSFNGGAGAYKVGANYGPTILPQRLCLEKGYSQVLWLAGDYVTEAGTMNLLCFWKNKQGEDELITCPLNGLILPGVIRRSCLELATQWGEFKVTERNWTIQELIEAIGEGRVYEMFGAGTAATVCPVEGFGYKDQYYSIPCGTDGKAGSLTHRFLETLTNITHGRVASEWAPVIGTAKSE